MSITLSQRVNILSALKRGDTITPMDALQKFGCFRLAARIKDLRDDGWDIETDMSEGYASYYLVSKRRKAA